MPKLGMEPPQPFRPATIMDEIDSEPIPLQGTQLVDQLMAEQDDVIRQLDELDAKILQIITALTQDREQADKSAA